MLNKHTNIYSIEDDILTTSDSYLIKEGNRFIGLCFGGSDYLRINIVEEVMNSEFIENHQKRNYFAVFKTKDDAEQWVKNYVGELSDLREKCEQILTANFRALRHVLKFGLCNHRNMDTETIVQASRLAYVNIRETKQNFSDEFIYCFFKNIYDVEGVEEIEKLENSLYEFVHHKIN